MLKESCYGLGGTTWEVVRPGHDVTTIMQHPRSAFDPLMTMRAHAQETARFASRARTLSDAEMRNYFSEAGLTEPRVLDLYPFEMSGGMLQRAMVAIALIAETPFLVADEPTTAMDLVVQTRVLDMLKRVAQTYNIGMLFVTHDMGVVAHMATDVAVMEKGHIIELNTVERIFDAPQHEQHPRAPAQIQRVLDLELEVGEAFDAGQPHRLDRVDEQRPERIVPPARVAPAEHQHWRGYHRLQPGARRGHFVPLHRRTVLPGHGAHALYFRSSSVPSASTSVTSSGILPSAWVAQDRQGSKARMATSMWLSRPSVISCPSRYCFATSRTAVFIAWLLLVVRHGQKFQ